MSLSKTQQRFSVCIGFLIVYAHSKGYGLTFGDAFRDSRVFGRFGEGSTYSHDKSVHKLRLAVDFNLFIEGKFITDGDHPAYKDLGQYWKTLDALARWGGDFEDANHFSFSYWGVK